MDKKLVFAINPNSGTQIGSKVKTIRTIIGKVFPPGSGFTCKVYKTRSVAHTLLLANKAVDEKAYAFVVSGGDGTINSVLKALAGTETALGIIPSGSGNGFARGLKIPLDYKAAVEFLKTAGLKTLDLGLINNEYFVNIAGIGLDAQVAHMFADKAADVRGAVPYFLLSAKEIATYKPITFNIQTPTSKKRIKALLMAFANGPQYGMGAVIDPNAKHGDGILSAVYFRKESITATILLAASLFNETADKFSKHFNFSYIKIKTDTPVFYHVDGEPRPQCDEFEIAVKPGQLKIIA